MSDDFQIVASNANAPFTLKLHRGDGMTLLAMNWKAAKPPRDFVGFAIEYKEPGGDRFWAVRNRINFPGPDGSVNRARTSSRLSPIQKFRWVHFPVNADMAGEFLYRVTPVFMSASGELSYGEAQEAGIVLARETYPGKLNVAFTRGFVSSQAFVDRYVTDTDGMDTLIPATADEGLQFVPTHPKATEALQWMGFEARSAILELLDAAIADKTAAVCVACYDLNDPAIVSRLEKLRKRLRIIIDDSATHKPESAAESQAAARLVASAGAGQVKRQHMSNLQHNKVIVVDGKDVKAAICGSTNFTWRGQFVQSNNAIVVRGKKTIQPFIDAFENYWAHDFAKGFGPTPSTEWQNLQLKGIDASITFSPHAKDEGVLQSIADDILGAKSSVFYSLAFLNQTGGAVTEAIKAVTRKKGIFVYGISDKRTGGLDVQLPDGKVAPVFVANLSGNLPEPFKSEPTGLGAKGGGTRMHHKFVVIDFDKPNARVYMGSYNFSKPADNENGENLLLIKDRRVAVSYMIQALTLFDHYHFRVSQARADASSKPIQLQKAPKSGQKPWWDEDYTDPRKILDRKLFA
ncbi:phospholipase D-like domain-containing protein [Uliginosibacterium sp. 31-16]|uniref:phospholipase D-like domain-containing protein n=1 Tax=Uliginosibacterium sp. 31-16 TaxID=3068315 RepID=UPI00273CFD66|nr:phospholipase D-like domain-containing protein [Uliginosibacterium sp. 31-16]MDP5239646.1 phospholipase D-like domain-containing protein [Uliginosibacterium sp. 31-16]